MRGFYNQIINGGVSIWLTGNVQTAAMQSRQTDRLMNARRVKRNVNLWTTPAIRRIARQMALIKEYNLYVSSSKSMAMTNYTVYQTNVRIRDKITIPIKAKVGFFQKTRLFILHVSRMAGEFISSVN